MFQNERSATRSHDKDGGRRPMSYRSPTSLAVSGGVFLTCIGIGVLGFPRASNARVTQINITTTEAPTFGGTSFGAVGQYERIEGTITGEGNPNNPQNAVIVDVGLASPKNTNGTVGYTA